MKGPADEETEFIDVHRLLVEVERALCDCASGTFPGAVARRDDDLGVRRDGHDLFECCKPLDGAIGIGRQAEIQRHDRGLVGPHRGHRGFAVACNHHLIVFVGPAQLALQPGIILHNKQNRLLVGRWRGGHVRATL